MVTSTQCKIDGCFQKRVGFSMSKYYNAITDGGVALPKFLLTIVMKLSNFKSLRISRNSKDSKKAKIGSWRVRSRPLRIRPSRSRPSRLRRSGRLPLNATDCSRLAHVTFPRALLPRDKPNCPYPCIKERRHQSCR